MVITEAVYTIFFITIIIVTLGIIWAKESRCKEYYKAACSEDGSYNKEVVKEIEALKRAVKRNQFVLYYQPKIDTMTQKLVGMEALIRWKHPQKGLLFPAQFIHLAEQTGLVTEIGKWVLREACRQNKVWQDRGYNKCSVSVNFSALEFYQNNMLANIKEMLSVSQLDPKYLIIELTESMALLDKEQAISRMKEIKALGVKVALDDFGTGYSSLSYLKELPIDELKFDRTFIIDIENNNISKEIIQSMIKLARRLNITTVAEGVDSEKQAELLSKMGCDMIQGYYYSAPISADLFEDRYMKNV